MAENRIRGRLRPVLLALLLTVLAALTAFAAESEQENAGSAVTVEQTQAEAKAKVITGWKVKKNKTYYYNQKGEKVTGLQKIDGKYYYFSAKGVQKTGWIKIKGKKYYFDPEKNGSRAKGWTNIGKDRYYFKSSGLPRSGWLKKSGKYYYLSAEGKAVTGWKTIGGKRYYFNKKTGARSVGIVTIKGAEYAFDTEGVLARQGFLKDGSFIDSTGHRLKKNTVKGLLQTALQPVGSTLYIWGGGWNMADTGSGITSKTIGVRPEWKAFFNTQGSSYNYNNYRYQSGKGLDCSGYIGWVIYNAFNTTSGHAGYVMLAQHMTRTFSGYGWGKYTSAGAVTDFKAGDIMSLASGHVYMVVGQCADGSVVLLHASPPGVMLSGTSTRAGNRNSQAVRLATSYMKKYFPEYYAKFPDSSRGASYLTSYSQMRWYVGTKKSMLTDPEGLREKNAKKVLKAIFDE